MKAYYIQALMQAIKGDYEIDRSIKAKTYAKMPIIKPNYINTQRKRPITRNKRKHIKP